MIEIYDIKEFVSIRRCDTKDEYSKRWDDVIDTVEYEIEKLSIVEENKQRTNNSYI